MKYINEKLNKTKIIKSNRGLNGKLKALQLTPALVASMWNIFFINRE
jgi:hypothetical protein